MSKEINSINENIIDSFTEEKYWKEKFKGNIERTAFPKDAKRYRKDPDFKTIKYKIDDKISYQINKLSNNSKNNELIILLSSLILLLQKYTGSNDIFIGTPVLRQEHKNLINTLLTIRYSLDQGDTFKDLLVKTKNDLIESSKHQNYPHEKILYQLDMDYSSTDEYPIFDIIALLDDLQEYEYISNINVNIVFSFYNENNLKYIKIRYNNSNYSTEFVNSIACNYCKVLKKAMDNITLPLARIGVLADSELAELLKKIDTEERSNLCIHDLFAKAITKENKDQIAIVYQDQQISYDELDIRSDIVSQNLLKKGVKNNVIVGITIEPSIDFVISIIGILKSGGGFLIINLNNPKEYIRKIIQDSNINLIIGSIPGIYFTNDIAYCDLESLYQSVQPTKQNESVPSDLAYVVYTSGTTSQPKGIISDHQGVAAMLNYRKNEYDYNKNMKSLVVLAYTFDSYISSLFTPLISCAPIVILPNYVMADGLKIIALIKRHSINYLTTVPSAYKMLLDNTSPKDIKSISKITLGGEKINQSLITKHNELGIEAEIINEYGLSEASVVTSLSRNYEKKNNSSIGKPIKENYTIVLNRDLQLQPIDVNGEIYIAGTGLSRGYLNNPALSHEKFVMLDPDLQIKAFKTGDLGYNQKNNELIFIGRKDTQVQIRGKRIEISQIEDVLIKHKQIKEVKVLYKEENNNEGFLIAFYVTQDIITGEEIKKYLSSVLPSYMIPNYYLEMEAFPLTKNGKIDSREMLANAHSTLNNKIYTEPINETEKKLCEIWGKVLNLNKISTTDGFFHIGGDSIKSIRLLSQINMEFNSNLEVVDLYENETIKELSSMLKLTNSQANKEGIEQVTNDFDDIKDKLLNQL